MASRHPAKVSLVCRAALEPDAAAIAQIYNYYVDAGGATFDNVHWTDRQVVEQLLRPPPDGWFVAMVPLDAPEQGTILGWCSAHRFSIRHGFRFSVETAIYLDATAVGQGVADALHECLDAHCRRHQIHHAVAKIIAMNDRSIAFHRRHGYEPVGVQKQVGNMQGDWIDLAILQKLY